MAGNDEFWRRRHRQSGHFDGQTPQLLRDVAPGKPMGAPPPVPQGYTPPTGPGTVQPCVLPKHWYLGTLPPERVKPSMIVRRSDYNNSGTNVVERLIEIGQGMTFVAFLYHFLATTPLIGNRTALVAPHEFLGHVELKLRASAGKAIPYIMGAEVSGTAFGGMPLLTDAPWNDWQEVPLFFNGEMSVEPVYTVRLDVDFDVDEIIFILHGFQCATADLERTIQDCSVLDR